MSCCDPVTGLGPQIFELDLVVHGLRLHMQIGREKVWIGSNTCSNKTDAATLHGRSKSACSHRGAVSVVDGVVHRARLPFLKGWRRHRVGQTSKWRNQERQVRLAHPLGRAGTREYSHFEAQHQRRQRTPSGPRPSVLLDQNNTINEWRRDGLLGEGQELSGF